MDLTIDTHFVLPDLPVARLVIQDDHYEISVTALFENGTSHTCTFKPREWRTARGLAWKIAYAYQLQPRRYNTYNVTCEWVKS